MQISTLMDQSHYTLPPSTGRHFGGTKTDKRARKCIAYAWRQHRSSGDPAPFWFRVTGSVFRSAKTGAAVVTGGRVIGFVTAADRTRAIPHLRKMGYDSFTEFRDVNATFALQIGTTPKPQPPKVVVNHGLSAGVLFSNRVKS